MDNGRKDNNVTKFPLFSVAPMKVLANICRSVVTFAKQLYVKSWNHELPLTNFYCISESRDLDLVVRHSSILSIVYHLAKLFQSLSLTLTLTRLVRPLKADRENIALTHVRISLRTKTLLDRLRIGGGKRRQTRHCLTCCNPYRPRPNHSQPSKCKGNR